MDNLPENITHEIIFAFLDGKTSSSESHMIQEWIDASEENRKYIEHLKIIWCESNMLNPAPVPVNVDAAWSKLSSRMDAPTNNVVNISKAKGSSKTIYKTLLKIAAVLIAGIIITYLFVMPKKEVKQIAISTTEKSQQKQLPDGSTINLNAHSRLTYPEKFEKNIREVSLEGEAFFEVKPDAKKPFVIHAADANIKVLGTSFNVNAYKSGENIEVFVKTGKVLLYGIDSISGDTSKVELVAGNKGIYNSKTKKAYKAELSSENDLFWFTKTLIFNKTELSEVVKILNKNFNVDIELKNKSLNNLRLSATFNNQSIESIINVIATSFNLSVTKTDSTFQINGQGN